MRTSPVYYISPSAISITPNANGSQRDLAVFVARNTKIKVYSRDAGIDVDKATSSYQEWTLTGRNRRLADAEGNTPYTIYARLSRSNKNNGYIVFAPKKQRNGEWIDQYRSVTTEGYSTTYIQQGDSNYWYIRLGDVSTSVNGERTVELDTGILGTDDYNENWKLDPDQLPLRIELGCTVNDEDAGPTPYVYWGQSLVLTASLVEGWANVTPQRFDHWEIVRNTGDADADAHWLSNVREAAFGSTGEIELFHHRDKDDFNGAVSATFTITAYGKTEEGGDGFTVLAEETINIHAETVEKFELVLSAAIMGYNPQTSNYTPSDGINVSIRATDQRGNVFGLSRSQIAAAGLTAGYKATGDSLWQTIAFSTRGADGDFGNIPSSAFSSQQGINVRLVNADGKELASETIAFVRDGEDSKEREWIFLHSQTESYGAAPASIDTGEVRPNGAASGADTNKNKDGWVPQGWYDNPQGISSDYPYEFGAFRDYDHAADVWGPFSTPRIWNHFAEDAVTYDIVPSVSVINAQADGTVISDGIIVRAYRTDGNTRSDNVLPESDYPDEGAFYYAEYSADGGTWVRCKKFYYPTGPSDDIEWIDKYGIGYSVVEAVRDNISFRLKHSDKPDVVLKETAPIKVVKDGAKAPYDVYAYARSTSREDYSMESIDSSNDYDGWFPQAPTPTDSYPYIWQRIRHYTSDDEIERESYICLTGPMGKEGGPGKTGRFFYYAGDYAPGEEYKIEETQAPYVKYDGSFWMLDNGGVEPAWLPFSIRDKTPGESDKWTKMSSDHQYYIARAFFGENAYLGSFIINGDWMISQYGTLYSMSGTAYTIDDTGQGLGFSKSTAYTMFNPKYPATSDPDGINFAPNFAVDGKTGRTYQSEAYIRGEVHATSGDFQNVKISGGMRSPFTYITPNGTFDNDFSDNVAIYSTDSSKDANDEVLPTEYNIPWDASQSGRRIIVANYKWGNGTQTPTGYVKINAPSGKYFFEDGIQKSAIYLSREIVELIGYGDSSSFYGWIVLTRTDLGTNRAYGHNMKVLAMGMVTVTGSTNADITAMGQTFDKSSLSLTRNGVGKYTITFGNTDWFEHDEDVFVMVTGCGSCVGASDNPVYANLNSKNKNGFTVWTGDDDSLNDGSFNFIVMNYGDWSSIVKKN